MTDATKLVPCHWHSMAVPPKRSDRYKVRYSDGEVRLVDHCSVFGWCPGARDGVEWSWREPTTDEAISVLRHTVQRLLNTAVHVIVDDMYHVSEFSAQEPGEHVWDKEASWLAGDYLQLEMEVEYGTLQWEFSMSQLCAGYLNWLHTDSFTLHAATDAVDIFTTLDFFRRVPMEPDPSMLKWI